jgi:hypothetical protein
MMESSISSSSSPSEWHTVNVTGVAGALFATLPLPLAGSTEGPEEDNGGSNNDSNGNNDINEDNDNSDGNSDGVKNNFF